MALSNEDKKDVARSFGKKAANEVSKVTKDDNYSIRRSVAKHEFRRMTDNLPGHLKRSGSYRSHLKNHLLKENDPTKWEKYSPKHKALSKRSGSSFDRMNSERKRQGYKPKTDRATKGLYDFLDN